MAGFVEGVDRGQVTLFPALLDDYVADDNRAWLPMSSSAISFDNFSLNAWHFRNDAPHCGNT